VKVGIIATVAIIFVLIFTFGVRFIDVEGISMAPTLLHGDRFAITRLWQSPNNGDIVVVVFPEPNDFIMVSRVIATGGQTIDIDFKTGVVYVNGEPLNEPYIAEPTRVNSGMIFPQTVPDGHMFVMGDNRNNSFDSRDLRIGMVDTRHVLGRVAYIHRR